MKKWAATCIIFAIVHWAYRRKMGNILARRQKESNKYLDNYQMLNHWLAGKNAGGNVNTYFEEKGYRSIAIYGMGDLANRLCEDLAGSKVKVLYGIDRDACNTFSRMDDVYSLNDRLPIVDAVIVTPFYDMEQIRASLEPQVNCPIISLEEVVWSI